MRSLLHWNFCAPGTLTQVEFQNSSVIPPSLRKFCETLPLLNAVCYIMLEGSILLLQTSFLNNQKLETGSCGVSEWKGKMANSTLISTRIQDQNGHTHWTREKNHSSLCQFLWKETHSYYKDFLNLQKALWTEKSGMNHNFSGALCTKFHGSQEDLLGRKIHYKKLHRLVLSHRCHRDTVMCVRCQIPLVFPGRVHHSWRNHHRMLDHCSRSQNSWERLSPVK